MHAQVPGWLCNRWPSNFLRQLTPEKAALALGSCWRLGALDGIRKGDWLGHVWKLHPRNRLDGGTDATSYCAG